MIHRFVNLKFLQGFTWTLRFMFQSPSKFLQGFEINESMDHAFSLLNKALKAKIRS